MPTSRTDRLARAVLVLLGACLAWLAITSAGWRMEHDTPLLHYVAFLLDRYDLFPYRDVFETSMPGTFAFHYLIVHFAGSGDAAFRAVDLSLLALLLGGSWTFMSRFGRMPAAWALVVFGLIYLVQGQQMSLQKDYVGLIPVALALNCIPRRIGTPVPLTRFVVLGLLFGVAATIKPHLPIALPVLFLTLLAYRRRAQTVATMDAIACVAATATGFVLPIAAIAAWLASHGALGAFLDIFVHYVPLHNALDGRQQLVTGSTHIAYLIKMTLQFGGLLPLFLCGLFAFERLLARESRADDSVRLSLMCLVACSALYAIYPAIAGKFWTYHYMPFAYFCSLTAACLLIPSPSVAGADKDDGPGGLMTVVVLTIAILSVTMLPLVLRITFYDLAIGPTAHAPKNGRVDQLAGWLRENLEPGDTVQPLDWTGGVDHALLIAHARLATRFMYDYHFYHHVSTPYVQGLRAQFMDQLRAARPRFIIEVPEDKPWVGGEDTSREFPELRQFIAAQYIPAAKGSGWIAYRRNDTRSP